MASLCLNENQSIPKINAPTKIKDAKRTAREIQSEIAAPGLRFDNETGAIEISLSSNASNSFAHF